MTSGIVFVACAAALWGFEFGVKEPRAKLLDLRTRKEVTRGAPAEETVEKPDAETFSTRPARAGPRSRSFWAKTSSLVG